MNFNKHSELNGLHAFLGASKYHWIRYDEEKLVDSFTRALAAQKGTETHEFAASCIKRNQKLPKSQQTLNLFVNDAIGFRMEPEQILYYSENSFGTADAISIRKNTLRIHDLKTGISKASFDQLLIYAALYCLEYSKDPEELKIILRIYQFDAFEEILAEVSEVRYIMKKIILFDKKIKELIVEEAYDV